MIDYSTHYVEKINSEFFKVDRASGATELIENPVECIEAKVGLPVQITQNIDEMKEKYIELVSGAILLASKGAYARVDSFVKWISSTDFFSAPASTQFHESYPGGLLIHSLKVYNKCLSLMQSETFANVDTVAATICALSHDWCKIGLYESYMRNVKNEETGKWEQVTSYRRNQRGIPLGHGATSMFFASRIFPLSVEEALAIRWHQGRWNVCREEMNELQKANEMHPIVHLIQFADQLAITSF